MDWRFKFISNIKLTLPRSHCYILDATQPEASRMFSNVGGDSRLDDQTLSQSDDLLEITLEQWLLQTKIETQRSTNHTQQNEIEG